MTSLGARFKSITGLLTERRLTLFALLLITLLGAGLRFYNLGAKRLTPDEIYTVTLSARDLPYIWHKSRGVPVLFLITSLVLRLGDSESILRMPSALEGILGIVVLYKVGETIYGRKEGLVAALLLALSAYHLHYSQDLRFYPLLVLLSLLTLLFLWKALEGGKRRFWLGFVLTTVANLYNQTFAWLVLASEMIFAACILLFKHLFPPDSKGLPLSTRAKRALKPLLELTAVFALVVVLYLPAISPFIAGFFSQEFMQRKFVSSKTVVYPSTILSWETLSFSFFPDTIFGPFGAGTGLPLLLYGAAFLYGLIRSRPRQAALAILWIGLPFPVLASIGMRFFARYVIYILPLYLVVISQGVVSAGESLAGLVARLQRSDRLLINTSLQAFLWIVFGVLNLSPIQNHYRQPWDEWDVVAGYLMDNAKSGDLILCDGYKYGPGVDSGRCRQGVAYYSSESFQERHILATDKNIAREVKDYASEARTVWIVLWHRSPLTESARESLQTFSQSAEFKQVAVIHVDEGENLLENTVSALKTLIKLLRQPEAKFDLYLSLAEIYASQGDVEQARQALVAAKEVQPHHSRARARWEMVSGRLQIDIDLGSADYHLDLGDAYLADGKTREAVEEYERALALDSSLDQQVGFHLRLGKAYEESGRCEEAIREYERVLELKPDNAAAQRALETLDR